MTKDETLKLALEALEEAHYKIEHKQDAKKREKAITAIKEALAQPEHGWTPERIAGMARLKEAQDKRQEFPKRFDTHPTPPQRTWVGLTDEEIDQGLVRTNYAMQTAGAWRDGVEWAVKQLQERNT